MPEILGDIDMFAGERKKKCTYCKRFKSLDKFGKDKGQSSGLKCRCKGCMNLIQRQDYANSSRRYEDMTKRALKRLYGISLEQYKKMADAQMNCCAICGKHQKNFNHRLAVDHCHETGKIRGLLCAKCNTGIGNFKDDIHLLGQAIEYLRCDTR
jgi:hypothetical protein